MITFAFTPRHRQGNYSSEPRLPVLSHDRRDLAAALQTSRESAMGERSTLP
jgi:hypothetical protein